LMISHRTTALNQMDGCYQLIDGKLQSFPLPC